MSNLPPAYISVGSLDLFLEENVDYATRMLRAGVNVELHIFPGAYHGYEMAAESRIAIQSEKERRDALKESLHCVIGPEVAMKTRKLGSHGPEVSAIGYGAMGIHLAYGPSDEAESLDTVRRAVDLGITFFDTAEMYGWGENEKFLGRAVQDVRDNIVIATKFGFQQTANPYEIALDSSPENIRKVTENSLRYLGTDRIDLLYQHRPDPDVPVEDVAGAVADLVREGKVLHFGMSEVGEKTIRRAHTVQPVCALQTEYSLFERDVESLFPALRELGIGLVPYCPLGRGFLTGQAKPANEYDQMDIRSFDPRWQPGNYEKNVEAVQNWLFLPKRKARPSRNSHWPGCWHRGRHRSNPRHTKPEKTGRKRRRRRPGAER